MNFSFATAFVRRHWRACIVALCLVAVLITGAWALRAIGNAVLNRSINKNEAAAQQAEQKAAVSEANADVLRSQRTETEQRIATRQPTLTQRKVDYEKSKTAKSVPGDDADLDERERQLLTKLKSLYPDQ